MPGGVPGGVISCWMGEGHVKESSESGEGGEGGCMLRPKMLEGCGMSVEFCRVLMMRRACLALCSRSRVTENSTNWCTI